MPSDHREKAFESAIEHHLITTGGKAGEALLDDRCRALNSAAVTGQDQGG